MVLLVSPRLVSPVQRPPDIWRGMTSLYVYVSVRVATPHLVGDPRMPLLRIIPLKGASFTNAPVKFWNIHYVPMAYTDSREVVSIVR